jgi:ATP phosphoribosyltransferase regulatory subunit
MIEIQKRDIIKQKLAQFGGQWVDLPTFLPAETVLELAGESLRPRLYFATAPNGAEICLRADLTIPSALHYLENYNNENSQKTYLCSGKVYRAVANADYKSHEFRQMGIEHFGDQNKGAEIDLFLAINLACESANQTNFVYEFFDGGLIKYILKNAQIDEVWRDYLLDSAFDIVGLMARIKIAANHQKPILSPIAKMVKNLETNDAIAAIEEVLRIAKLKTFEARNVNAITKRLKQKAMRATIAPLNQDVANNLLALLEVKDNVNKSLLQIQTLAKSLGVNLEDWHKIWSQRFEKIFTSNPKIKENAYFSAAKTGRFEYYDGFAFEIFMENDLSRSAASGGRYDGLLRELSNGQIDKSAVGGVLRPEILFGENNG